MKRDLLFVVERLAGLVDERRLEIVARQRGIKREKDIRGCFNLDTYDSALTPSATTAQGLTISICF
jgi:uncharacterized protein YprB with RNaseH-like and TPR domain